VDGIAINRDTIHYNYKGRKSSSFRELYGKFAGRDQGCSRGS
jgi:hypothetical protein